MLIYDINLWHRGSTNFNGKKKTHKYKLQIKENMAASKF